MSDELTTQPGGDGPGAAGGPAAVDAERYGPWAVIAGGSEGVGSELAYVLADAGINTVLLARRQEPLDETAAEVRRRGAECRVLAVDLTASDAVARIAGVTDDLDIGLVVLNAGANTYGSEFIQSDLDRVQTVIDLNITSPMQLVRHFGPKLRDRRGGGICVMGSMAGYLGHRDMSIYSGVKAFSRVWVEGLWLEMKDHDVDVVEVVLGVTRTPAMERAGLDMDQPGLAVADPADVAREVVGRLGDGPVAIIGGEANEKQIGWSSGTDRARIVAGADRHMQKLRGSA